MSLITREITNNETKYRIIGAILFYPSKVEMEMPQSKTRLARTDGITSFY